MANTCMLYWLVLSDEQMSKGCFFFSLLNDEQMSNWLGVEHQPVIFLPTNLPEQKSTTPPKINMEPGNDGFQ